MIEKNRTAMELAQLLRQEKLQVDALHATTARIRTLMRMIREDLTEEPVMPSQIVRLPAPDLSQTIRFPLIAD